MKLQQFTPLEPLPLIPDSAKMRSDTAELELNQGNLERALTEYQQALRLDPGSSDTPLKIAYIQWELMNRREASLATLRELLRKHPDNAIARRKIAEIEAGRRYDNNPPPSPESPRESYNP